MRAAILFLCLASLSGCASASPPIAYGQAPRLPYSACGDMAALRNNLTGTPHALPETDAELRSLGVRCIGAPAIIARTGF